MIALYTLYALLLMTFDHYVLGWNLGLWWFLIAAVVSIADIVIVTIASEL